MSGGKSGEEIERSTQKREGSLQRCRVTAVRVCERIETWQRDGKEAQDGM